ncbi:hypothetical protein V6N12_005503 [Hibiscus sabdariffa]|uniref:RING-type E3 ubiquitin transferase n=1 Tax=Hibiscus sabdariffa TaxID=183260 RepID=A0ABR2B886_9ROSI
MDMVKEIATLQAEVILAIRRFLRSKNNHEKIGQGKHGVDDVRCHERGAGHVQSSILAEIIDPAIAETDGVKIKKEDGGACGICLEDMEKGEEVRVMGVCGHKFHDHCIFQWVKRKQNCPLCRCVLENTRVHDLMQIVVLPQFVHGDSYIAQDDPVPQRSVATEAIEDGIIPEEVQNHEFATEEIQNHEFATEEVQNHGVEDTGSVHADVHEASNGAANVHADVVPVIRRSSRVTVVVVEGGSARNGGGSTSSPVLHLSEVYAATGGCLLGK